MRINSPPFIISSTNLFALNSLLISGKSENNVFCLINIHPIILFNVNFRSE